MVRDKLILLAPGFEDTEHPTASLYCWQCALMEGVVSSFPQLYDLIDVERIAWQRPREKVVQAIGSANQSLPVLVLADDAGENYATGAFQGRRFVTGKDAILDVLSRRHGIPFPHP